VLLQVKNIEGTVAFVGVVGELLSSQSRAPRTNGGGDSREETSQFCGAEVFRMARFGETEKSGHGTLLRRRVKGKRSETVSSKKKITPDYWQRRGDIEGGQRKIFVQKLNGQKGVLPGESG